MLKHHMIGIGTVSIFIVFTEFSHFFILSSCFFVPICMFIYKYFQQNSLLCFFPIVFLLCRIDSYQFPYLEIIQAQFHQSFEEKCLQKYPKIVQSFVNKLDFPGDRYLMFVFEEPSLKNGGLGDRLAGLVSAMAMALRFNRTLLLRDSSGLARYFRPYHPIDIHAEKPKYRWDDYLSWSNYKVSQANHDETEYDLYYCINHNNQRTSSCSMDRGDVPQPIILLRSNRVYLCHYELATQTVAHTEWRKEVGITASDDLYELSGCLLRLALWPTSELWEDVDDKYYQEMFSRLLHQNITHLPSFSESENESPSERKPNNRKESKARSLRASSRRVLSSPKFAISDETQDESRHHGHHQHNPQYYNESSMKERLNDFYQIGIHFRCGDHSYMHNAHDYDCRYEVENPSSNPYMLEGNPYELSSCTKEILLNHTRHLVQEHRSILTDEALQREVALSEHEGSSSSNSPISNALHQSQFIMFFTASDNSLSSNQIQEVINYSHTLVSPAGCHVEWDHSWACFSLTATYWFMMAQSKYLSVQIMDDKLPAPASSFSRYAGIYGLRTNPFRSGKHCKQPINNFEFSRIQHNNWFC